MPGSCGVTAAREQREADLIVASIWFCTLSALRGIERASSAPTAGW